MNNDKKKAKGGVHFGFKEYLRIAVFTVGIVALAFSINQYRSSKNDKIPEQILQAAPIDEVISSTVSGNEAGTDTEENTETDSSSEASSEIMNNEPLIGGEIIPNEPVAGTGTLIDVSQNIDTAQDYVNFERLIMQISEYTEPDMEALEKESSELVEYTKNIETKDAADAASTN